MTSLRARFDNVASVYSFDNTDVVQSGDVAQWWLLKNGVIHMPAAPVVRNTG